MTLGGSYSIIETPEKQSHIHFDISRIAPAVSTFGAMRMYRNKLSI